VYTLDPIIRRDVNTALQAKGYVLDEERAQFTVDYIYANGLRQGERSQLASNITPYPRVTPNRQVNQATVDNAIALGGVQETNNITLQFNDSATNQEVWQATLSKVVEDANNIDATRLDDNLQRFLERALESMPPAGQ
jgi:D-mannonate dehydratase